MSFVEKIGVWVVHKTAKKAGVPVSASVIHHFNSVIYYSEPMFCLLVFDPWNINSPDFTPLFGAWLQMTPNTRWESMSRYTLCGTGSHAYSTRE